MGFLSPDMPATPVEDPEIARMRKQEQERAEADKTRATQKQLGLETQFANQNTGTRSLLGKLGSGRRSMTSLLGW